MKDELKNFKALHLDIITALQDLVLDIKKEIKAPGLTWEQLDYLFEGVKNIEPTIIEQEHEQ